MSVILYEVSKAIATVLLDESINDRTRLLRMEAIRRLPSIMNIYMNEFHNEELITRIFNKKLAFIMEAASKKEIDKIMSPPDIHYDGNKIRPANEYVIPEEELLIWSRTSLMAPLIDAGYRRFEELFKEIFPERSDILGV